MPNKMERFTQRARRVLSLAQEEAERLQHNYIGTEHLLLGLVREGDGVAAGRICDARGHLDSWVDLDGPRAEAVREADWEPTAPRDHARRARAAPGSRVGSAARGCAVSRP